MMIPFQTDTILLLLHRVARGLLISISLNMLLSLKVTAKIKQIDINFEPDGSDEKGLMVFIVEMTMSQNP